MYVYFLNVELIEVHNFKVNGAIFDIEVMAFGYGHKYLILGVNAFLGVYSLNEAESEKNYMVH